MPVIWKGIGVLITQTDLKNNILNTAAYYYHYILIASAEPHYNFTILGECKLSYLTIPVLQSCFSWDLSGHEENELGRVPIPRLTV